MLSGFELYPRWVPLIIPAVIQCLYLQKFHEEIIVSTHHQEPFLSVTTTEDISLVLTLFAFIWTTCCPLRKNEGLQVVQCLQSSMQELLESLGNYDDDHNDDFKKTIGLMVKTTALHVHHAFQYISLTSTARLRRETS